MSWPQINWPLLVNNNWDVVSGKQVHGIYRGVILQYFVVALLAITLVLDCTQRLSVYFPSMLGLPVNLIIKAVLIRTNKRSLVQKYSAYSFSCFPCLISHDFYAVCHASWPVEVLTWFAICFDKQMRGQCYSKCPPAMTTNAGWLANVEIQSLTSTSQPVYH